MWNNWPLKLYDEKGVLKSLEWGSGLYRRGTEVNTVETYTDWILGSNNVSKLKIFLKNVYSEAIDTKFTIFGVRYV